MTTPQSPLPPPGWYPDPSGAPGQRYFDGAQWTERRAGANRPPRAVWLWVILAVVVLFFGGCAALVAVGSSGDSSDDSVTRVDGAGIGQHVRNGRFDFLVTGVRTSSQPAGLSKPRGEYVIVTMTVTNVGDQPQTFFAQNQKLIDSAGREYRADSMAAIAMNSDSIFAARPRLGVMAYLNPGFKINVNLPFDVPPGTTPAEIQLHDPAFSRGVSVKLG